MANVSIKFNNKEFLLSCEDGQEEHLEELLIHINQKFNDLKNNLGNLGENKLLLITAVKIMDEYFETKKISSETFVKDEIKSINWKDVDQYPIFKNCELISNKEQQKSCFESTLSSYIYLSINVEETVVTTDLNETLTIDFMVDKKGKLMITSMIIDSLISAQIPLLEKNIKKAMDSIQPIAPAYKRGIPVKTSFQLPLEIKTIAN